MRHTRRQAVRSSVLGLCGAIIGLPGLAQSPAPSPLSQVICDSAPRLRDQLQRRTGAVPRAMGLRGPDELLEVWTDARGGWTMVITYAGGSSCIVAMGDDWQTLERDPA